MIDPQSYSKEQLFKLRNELGGRVDPKLLEKVVRALLFLEQLKLRGLSFVFKGGTCLLLAMEKPLRFSIDIDLITEEPIEDIEMILQGIIDDAVFIRWEDDNRRKHTADAPVGHYKVFYTSQIDGREEPILLDLLYTPNPYPVLLSQAVRHDWIINVGEDSIVDIPSFEAILGDKLTAFAPYTTGILYSKNRPVEIIKQLFDIALLFDRIADLDVVRKSYDKVVHEEIRFRKLSLSKQDVLQDTLDACLALSERDAADENFKHLQLGVKNFTNFTIDRFRIEEAIVAAAKTAYLTILVGDDASTKIERYGNPLEMKDWIITSPAHIKLNKLKKTNPEAFFFWYKSTI